MRIKDWLVAATLALCVVGLVACGGGGSGSGSGGGEAAAAEEEGLEFTECLRAHGVEVEDPKPGQTNIAVDARDPKAKKALAACNGKLSSSGQELSSGEADEFREGALALAQCFREEGIEMGDPTFQGPGKFLLDIKGLDTTSPAFEAAREACGEKLPETSGFSVGG
jgi:hypothetical protein